MIYTSCFENLKDIPENIIPISICEEVPEWYKGLQYKKLAPKHNFFIKWEDSHNDDYYIKCFKEQVLNKTNVLTTLRDILNLIPDIDNSCNQDICLICYGKSTDFRHRYLISDWLNKNRINCVEYTSESNEIPKFLEVNDIIRKMECVLDMQDLYLPCHFKEWVIDELVEDKYL